MSLTYQRPDLGGSLRQGEILKDVWELRPRDPAGEPAEDSVPKIEPIYHPLAIIVAAACDLEQDFKVRFPAAADDPPRTPEALELRHETIPYITICTLFTEEEIRKARNLNYERFKLVRQNDNPRYHKLRHGRIGVWSSTSIEEPLFLDFRKAFAIPTAGIYGAIDTGDIVRLAVLPPLFAQDLVQRYHSYLSRVGLPDDVTATTPQG